MTTLDARSELRTLLGLLAALGMLAAMAMPALAASVVPTPVNDGNPTCGDFDASWTQLKVDAARREWRLHGRHPRDHDLELRELQQR